MNSYLICVLGFKSSYLGDRLSFMLEPNELNFISFDDYDGIVEISGVIYHFNQNTFNFRLILSSDYEYNSGGYIKEGDLIDVVIHDRDIVHTNVFREHEDLFFYLEDIKINVENIENYDIIYDIEFVDNIYFMGV